MNTHETHELNPGHFFELLDRSAVFASIFEDHIAAHPVVAADAELQALVDKARDIHGEIYAHLGKLWAAQGEG